MKEILYFGFSYISTSVITMSTQFTKEQLGRINIRKYLNIGKGLANLFYEETEKKIHTYIDILEKEASAEEKIEVAHAPMIETSVIITEDAPPTATADAPLHSL